MHLDIAQLWNSGKRGRFGLDASGLGEAPVIGSCEYGNKPLGSINDREFLDQLSN